MKFPFPPLQTPLGSIFEIAACDTPSVCFPLNSFKHLSLNGIPKNLSLQTEIITPFYRAFPPIFMIPVDWKWWRKAVSPGTFRTEILGRGGERTP